MAKKRLKTIKKASSKTGLSMRYIQQLLTDGALTTYKIRSSTMVSLEELENNVAWPKPKPQTA